MKREMRAAREGAEAGRSTHPEEEGEDEEPQPTDPRGRADWPSPTAIRRQQVQLSPTKGVAVETASTKRVSPPRTLPLNAPTLDAMTSRLEKLGRERRGLTTAEWRQRAQEGRARQEKAAAEEGRERAEEEEAIQRRARMARERRQEGSLSYEDRDTPTEEEETQHELDDLLRHGRRERLRGEPAVYRGTRSKNPILMTPL